MKHDCIVALHIGHDVIRQSQATRQRLEDTCCGGVKLMQFCPECGKSFRLEVAMKGEKK